MCIETNFVTVWSPLIRPNILLRCINGIVAMKKSTENKSVLSKRTAYHNCRLLKMRTYKRKRRKFKKTIDETAKNLIKNDCFLYSFSLFFSICVFPFCLKVEKRKRVYNTINSSMSFKWDVILWGIQFDHRHHLSPIQCTHRSLFVYRELNRLR